jgi:broad specificity phosphatase PhoE
MTTFFFIRHGETIFNKEKRYTGLTNIPISDSSRTDILNSIQVLENQKITEIYSSPLLRSLQTSLLISSNLNIKINIIDEFKEKDFGILTGRKKLQYKKKFFIKGSHPYIYKKTIKNALAKIKHKSNFIISGHSGTFEYICQILIKKNIKIRKIKNSQIVYFYKQNNDWKINFL